MNKKNEEKIKKGVVNSGTAVIVWGNLLFGNENPR